MQFVRFLFWTSWEKPRGEPPGVILGLSVFYIYIPWLYACVLLIHDSVFYNPRYAHAVIFFTSKQARFATKLKTKN